ncbi:hypothetical protein JCM10908_005312 [Rhodotorula pacifica]|uniref:tRNA maturation protein LHP1 n=1 Tax=Rhodotorula pacifica TaxID=1495444 RepID=UPI0031711A11
MSEATAPSQSITDAVLTQVEFYLSNSNLPFDKFLFNLWAASYHDPAAIIANTPAPEGSEKHPQSSHNAFHLGWLPLEKLASFKRMQPYLEAPPAGLGSVDAIADVVKSSSLVEVHKFGNEGETGAGWYVRRKSPLSKPEDAMQRSVYVKGFPATEKDGETDEERKEIKSKEDDLQKRLEAWARDLNVGKVLSVRMRREDRPGVDGKAPLKGKGKFKGSIFMEFAEKESVEKFLNLDPKPTFEGAALELKTKLDYVEEKRKLYAPDSAPITGASKDSVPKNPYSKSAKPFNAWAEQLVGENGFPIKPSAAAAARQNGKKRGAEDENEAEEREIMYDGVRFKARRTGGKDGKVELVGEESIGKGDGGWSTGKVFRFTIAKKDGSTSAESKEDGERFDFASLKKRLEPIAKPAFVSLVEDRQIAPLPAGASGDKDSTMKEGKSEFPTRLTAPPEIKSSAEVKKDDDAAAPAPEASSSGSSGAQQYPARGQASFKEAVTDETFDKLKSEVGEIDGRKVEWVRVSESDERAHQLSRARYHAEQAFSQERGGANGRGGRGGRGGGRGGRGGRGGGGRGGHNKRPRRD